MADENPKNESIQKEGEAKEKRGNISEGDLDNVSGGVFAGDSTCPVCGGPNDHIHENR